MNHFYIITNEHKDPGLQITGYIEQFLIQQGRKCTIQAKQHSSREETYTDSSKIPEDADCVLVLGGDGTMLQAAHDTLDKDIPLLGVNLGTLGYLAEVEKSGLDHALHQLMAGEYELEERMMLKGNVMQEKYAGETVCALNDISITRSGSLQIINYDIYVNGQYLKGYSADGIIIATPTGSTGYNLSAGGPIVDPKAKMILVTPICPHTFNTRSIVLSAEEEVTVQIAAGREGQRQKVDVNFDGGHKVELETGDCINIQCAEKVTKILKLNKVSFLEVLHKKMSE